MAVYTTLANLQKRLHTDTLAQLAHDGTPPPDITNVDTVAVITQIIADASAEVDSYLYGHLDMDDATIQAAVERATAHIALYRLFCRRPELFPDETTRPFYTEYSNVIDWCKLVAKGGLHVADDPQARSSAFVSTKTDDDDMIFTETTLTGW